MDYLSTPYGKKYCFTKKRLLFLITFVLLLLYRLDAEVDVTEAQMQELMQSNCFREKVREIIAEVLVDEAVGSFSETEEEKEDGQE